MSQAAFPSSMEPSEHPTHNAPLWPKVWGILSLIWAVLPLLLMCCASAALAAMAAAMGSDGNPMPTSVKLLFALGFIMAIALGVLLFIGALALLRRRRKARTLLTTYVVLQLVLTPISIFGALAIAKPQAEWMRGNMAELVRKMEKDGAKVDDRLREAATNADPPAAHWIVLQSSWPLIFPIALGICLLVKKDEMAEWPA